MHTLTRCLILFILAATTVSGASLAQTEKVVTGKVTDASTGKPLQAAHVRVTGIRFGTITNADGDYRLVLEDLPCEVSISYIGYYSKVFTVDENSPGRFDAALYPNPVKLDEIVVTPEDPAVNIMREVIRRKQEWLKSLESYSAEAYTRFTLANDTTITMMSESMSDIYWSPDTGIREVIRAKRNTENIEAGDVIASARMVPNLYNDDIDIAGHNLPGPTHPEAFDYYDFRLVARRLMDNRTVYNIEVTQKKRLQPSFTGTVSVLDSVYAMIGADLKPGRGIILPRPILGFDITISQQFTGEEGIWLPVDARIAGEIRVGLPGLTFPPFKYSQVTRLDNYVIQAVPPDTLFTEGKTRIDKTEDSNSDSLFAAESSVIVPLTVEEETAYSVIDSTFTIEKAYKPTGLLSRLVRTEVKAENADDPEDSGRHHGHEAATEGRSSRRIFGMLKGVRPVLHFNRVDETAVGLKYKRRFMDDRIAGEVKTAWLSGPDRWMYGGKADIGFGSDRRGTLTLSGGDETTSRGGRAFYPDLINSIHTLKGDEDYYDYYRRQYRSVGVSWDFKGLVPLPFEAALSFQDEDHTSLVKTTDFGLFDKDLTRRENPAIDEGTLRSVKASISYGNQQSTYGLTGQRRIILNAEYSHPDMLASDFDFHRVELFAEWHIDTYLRRRLLPPSLDIRLSAGTSGGTLPVQKFGLLNGIISRLGPFGTFRTLKDHPLEGEKWAAVFWEHNLRSIPFEMIRFDWPVRHGMGIIIHGAAGRTWIASKRLSSLGFEPRYDDSTRSEIGLTLNGIFSYLRLDVTKRLDERGIVVGFGLVRLF